MFFYPAQTIPVSYSARRVCEAAVITEVLATIVSIVTQKTVGTSEPPRPHSIEVKTEAGFFYARKPIFQSSNPLPALGRSRHCI
jgi:hypothetical protein